MSEPTICSVGNRTLKIIQITFYKIINKKLHHNQELQIHHNLVGRLVMLQWPLYFIAQKKVTYSSRWP